MHYVGLVMFALLLVPIRRVHPSVAWAITAGLVVFLAVYGGGSWDYPGYIEYYECTRRGNCIDDLADRLEYSFLATATVFGAIFGSAGGPLLVALYSSLATAIKVYILRQECAAFGVALLGYLCIGWLLHDVTQIRVGLAIALLWLAVRDSATFKRNWRAALWFALAVLTHYSAAVGMVFFLSRRVELTLKFWLVALIAAAALGATLAASAPQVTASAFAAYDARLALYAATLGNVFLTTSQFNVASTSTVLIVTLCLGQKIKHWTDFEVASLRCVVIGTLLYMTLYWLPIVGVRVFELLGAFLPIVGAAAYRTSRRLLVRVAIVVLFVGLFFNTVVRNGLMMDFMLPGQAQQRLHDAM